MFIHSSPEEWRWWMQRLGCGCELMSNEEWSLWWFVATMLPLWLSTCPILIYIYYIYSVCIHRQIYVCECELMVEKETEIGGGRSEGGGGGGRRGRWTMMVAVVVVEWWWLVVDKWRYFNYVLILIININ